MGNYLVNLLERGLDGAHKRQKLISNNIANVNTPNYKRKDLDFKETLKKEFAVRSTPADNNSRLSLKITDENHLGHFGKNGRDFDLNIGTDNNLNYKNDENNVDIDTEMVESTKNNLYYNTLIKQLDSKFHSLRNVIERGGN